MDDIESKALLPQRGDKISRKEKLARFSSVLDMLRNHSTKSQIKRAMRRVYGMSPRTCERYLADARTELIAESKKDRDLHIAGAYETYRAVIADSKAATKDRLRAQELLVKLLGLAAPMKISQTDAEGNDVAPTIDEVKVKLAEALGIELPKLEDKRDDDGTSQPD